MISPLQGTLSSGTDSGSYRLEPAAQTLSHESHHSHKPSDVFGGSVMAGYTMQPSQLAAGPFLASHTGWYPKSWFSAPKLIPEAGIRVLHDQGAPNNQKYLLGSETAAPPEKKKKERSSSVRSKTPVQTVNVKNRTRTANSHSKASNFLDFTSDAGHPLVLQRPWSYESKRDALLSPSDGNQKNYLLIGKST